MTKVDLWAQTSILIFIHRFDAQAQTLIIFQDQTLNIKHIFNACGNFDVHARLKRNYRIHARLKPDTRIHIHVITFIDALKYRLTIKPPHTLLLVYARGLIKSFDNPRSNYFIPNVIMYEKKLAWVHHFWRSISNFSPFKKNRWD